MIQRAPSTTEKRKCEREYEEQEAMKTKLLKIVELGERVKKNSIFVPNVAFTRLGEIKKSDFGWLEIRFRFYISLKDIYRENIRHNYLIIQGIRILLINCNKPMGVSHGYSLRFCHFNHGDFVISHKCWLQF